MVDFKVICCVFFFCDYTLWRGIVIKSPNNLEMCCRVFSSRIFYYYLELSYCFSDFTLKFPIIILNCVFSLFSTFVVFIVHFCYQVISIIIFSKHFVWVLVCHCRLQFYCILSYSSQYFPKVFNPVFCHWRSNNRSGTLPLFLCLFVSSPSFVFFFSFIVSVLLIHDNWKFVFISYP